MCHALGLILLSVCHESLLHGGSSPEVGPRTAVLAQKGATAHRPQLQKRWWPALWRPERLEEQWAAVEVGERVSQARRDVGSARAPELSPGGHASRPHCSTAHAAARARLSALMPCLGPPRLCITRESPFCKPTAPPICGPIPQSAGVHPASAFHARLENPSSSSETIQGSLLWNLP